MSPITSHVTGYDVDLAAIGNSGKRVFTTASQATSISIPGIGWVAEGVNLKTGVRSVGVGGSPPIPGGNWVSVGASVEYVEELRYAYPR